ncbi:MAG: response regulator [Terriglobales bacterium]
MARKILLADDSVTAQNMGRKILTDAGYDVLTVNNGSAALKRIAESRPDLIILDVYMPGYSGLEVCQRIKESPDTADIPVLLSVGKLEPFKPQEARRVRADAHIVKPFEASQLLTAVASLEASLVPQKEKPGQRAGASSSPIGTEETNARTERSSRSGFSFLGTKKKDAPEEARKDWPFRSTSEASEAAPGPAPSGQVPSSLSGSHFHDFRKVKAKEPSPETSGAESMAMAAAPTLQSIPVPNVPPDITPEELDALSAVAARLHEAHAEQGSMMAPAETPAEPANTAETEAMPAATFGDAGPAPAAEVQAAEAQTAEMPRPTAEVAVAETVPRSEFEIPVGQVEPASGTEVADAGTRQEFSRVEFQPVEAEDAESLPALMSAASFAEEPSPVDRQDEPVFAAAIADEIETQTAETHCETPLVAETQGAEAQSGVSLSAQSAPASDVAESPAAASEQGMEPDALMPSDAELAEALQLLTPTHSLEIAPASPAAELATEGGCAVGAESMSSYQDSSAKDAVPETLGSRWIAEAQELTEEEAALLLEAEMFRTFAASATESQLSAMDEPVAAIREVVDTCLAEAVTETVPTVDHPPKAMAAAAPAGTSPSVTADESTIASIVERVMADLRPKIVEEIARKLAGK